MYKAAKNTIYYLLLIIAFLLGSALCTPSLAQQGQPLGNPTSNVYSKGMLSADSALRAARIKKVYPYFDSTGQLAVVAGLFYYHDGTIWKTPSSASFDSTFIYAALADSVRGRVKYIDSNTIYVTPFQLKDSIQGRVKYTDSNTIYVTNVQLKDSVSGRQKYTDTLTWDGTKADINNAKATLLIAITDSVQGRVKYTDSTTIYPTVYDVDTAKANLRNNTPSVSGSTNKIAVFTGTNSIGNSNLFDSTSLGHSGVTDTFTAYSYVYIKTTPAAVNADSIFVKGSVRGTVRVAPGPTGASGQINVSWPGNVFSLPNVGTAGTYGSSTLIPVITTDAQGRSSIITTTITPTAAITQINTDATDHQTITIDTSSTANVAIVDNGVGDHKIRLPFSTSSSYGLVRRNYFTTSAAGYATGVIPVSTGSILTGLNTALTYGLSSDNALHINDFLSTTFSNTSTNDIYLNRGISFGGGAGGIVQIWGPPDTIFNISNGLKNSGAGNNMNFYTPDATGTTNVAGNFNVTTGVSQGNADGGYINLNATRSTGNNGRGGVVVIGSNGRVASSDNAGTCVQAALGNLMLRTIGTNTTVIGNINLATHTAASANVGVNAGAINDTTGTGGAGASNTIGAGGIGGAYYVGIGGGGSAAGGNSGINGGDAGTYYVVGGTGGNATNTGTHTGGNGTSMNFTTGNGGNATGASGTRTGGNAGSMTFTMGAVGTGATANGTLGSFNFVGSRTNFAAATTSYSSINFAAGTAPTTPVEGDMWADATQKSEMAFVDGIKQATPGIIFTQTADKAISNTTVETSFIGTGTGTGTLPANFWTVGKTIEMEIGGIYSTPAVVSSSVLIKIKYGSTVLASVTTSSLLTNASALRFSGKVIITCRTTGSSGTVSIDGGVRYSTGVAGTIAEDVLNNGGATVTLNTTTSNAMDITGQWDAATSTRSATSTIFVTTVKN